MSQQNATNQTANKPIMPGRFVTARSIEAKSLIRLLQEYDGCIVYIRNRWGRDGFNTQKANDIITRCLKIEETFRNLVDEMKQFIKETENTKKQVNLITRQEKFLKKKRLLLNKFSTMDLSK